jgi:DNA polymerase-3 subunit gamma/tau
MPEPESEPAPELEREPEPAGRPAPLTVLDLQAATDAWPAVVDAVRTRNAMLAALLADAHPASISDRALTLAFPTGAAFLKRKAEQDEHRRVATEAFRSITGQPLALAYELREVDEVPVAPGEPVLTGEELVQRFLEEFDAEELLELDETKPEGEA